MNPQDQARSILFNTKTLDGLNRTLETVNGDIKRAEIARQAVIMNSCNHILKARQAVIDSITILEELRDNLTELRQAIMQNEHSTTHDQQLELAAQQAESTSAQYSPGEGGC